MQIVTQGAEYHFLAFLEKIRPNPTGWIACTFPFSRSLSHETLMTHRKSIKTELAALSRKSDAMIKAIEALADDLPDAHICKFADNDIILMCCPVGELQQKKAREALESLASQCPKDFCDYGFLTKELYLYQKIADHKALSAKKMEAYQALGDEAMTNTLALRRKRRDEPVVMVVEDDRFTVSYISTFLKDFDLIIARNGEDALLKYMEFAPDAVFLDIHLPGLNGLQVLQGIRAADPEAFVVMLSVDTAQSSILSASRFGAASYLKKPFSRERLLNTLRISPFIRQSQGILPVFSEVPV